jgi:hypothetical protein
MITTGQLFIDVKEGELVSRISPEGAAMNAERRSDDPLAHSIEQRPDCSTER